MHYVVAFSLNNVKVLCFLVQTEMVGLATAGKAGSKNKSNFRVCRTSLFARVCRDIEFVAIAKSKTVRVAFR